MTKRHSKDSSKRMWGGRFTENMDALVQEFGASVDVDQRMAIEDIQGSIAHATMLASQGILTEEECNEICAGLDTIREDILAGNLEWDIALEDVHMNIEHELTKRIGSVGGKLHTGRSRNDQVATDLRLWLRSAGEQIFAELHKVRSVLVNQSEKHLGVIMPGYTHLQVAQPVLFSHHLMAYYAMFSRDSERLSQTLERMNYSPLGAGALAGTGFDINRTATANQLGFQHVALNSMDAVSDRDFVLDFLSFCSILMVHLSRLSEELILWSSQEFGFITLPDSYTTGSSIMPQKKNPDMCELIRGKTGRVCGSLMALLITMKGLPLTYNKDMQEDKEGVLDAADTVQMSLKIYSGMLSEIQIHPDRMREAAGSAYSNATDLADYLVRKGVPFREAHDIVGRLVMICLNEGTSFESLSMEKMKKVTPLIEEDVWKYLKLETVVNSRDSLGGTAAKEVVRQLSLAREQLTQERG